MPSPPPTPPPRRDQAPAALAAIGRRGAWALAEQALFAGTHFLLGVVAARWLAPQPFGELATTYAVFLLLAAIHAAALSEPMLVLGASQGPAERPAFLGALLHLHAWASLAVVGALAAAAAGLWLLGAQSLARPMAALAPAAPGMLLLWMARRACLLEATPRLAVAGGVGYLALMLLLLAGLRRAGSLGAASFIGAYGVAGLAAGAVLFAALGVRRPGGGQRRLRAALWAYARWSLPTSALAWVPLNAPFVLLPMGATWGATGALRALVTVVQPFVLANQAVGQALTPVVARAPTAPGTARALRWTAAALAAASAAGWIACGLFGAPLLELLYGGRYREAAGHLWLIGLLPVLNGAAGVLLAALRGRGRVAAAFVAHAAAAAFSATAGVAFTAGWGLGGAAASIVGAYAVLVAALAWLARPGGLTAGTRTRADGPGP